VFNERQHQSLADTNGHKSKAAVFSSVCREAIYRKFASSQLNLLSQPENQKLVYEERMNDITDHEMIVHTFILCNYL
jgi:hypothetical protein